MADFFADQKWFDPGLEKYGVGYAKAMTRFLYQNIVPANSESEIWPKYGLITQFDRVLTFAGAAVPAAGLTTGETQTLTLQTNNRNWMLISRAAVAVQVATEASLVNILVGCNADPGIQLIEAQPASLIFGDGQLPSIMLMPEEWPTNTFRRWTVTNNTPGNPVTVTLSFKFLQVRTAG